MEMNFLIPSRSYTMQLNHLRIPRLHSKQHAFEVCYKFAWFAFNPLGHHMQANYHVPNLPEEALLSSQTSYPPPLHQWAWRVQWCRPLRLQRITSTRTQMHTYRERRTLGSSGHAHICY